MLDLKQIVICLPTKPLRVLMNSFQYVHMFQIELEFESVGFWGEGKTGVPGENKQQTQPTYGFNTGIWTWATLVGDECSHHCVILVPPLLPWATNTEVV